MILQATALTHRYGPREVLREVDLAVAPGEVVALVGPNGSGKSTALRLLHRALVPQTGTVELEGRDLAGLSARERARSIAVMSQEAEPELSVSVADAVLLGRIPHRGGLGTPTHEDEAVAAAVLERVGALHLARQEMATLSGGERQRVLLARALAQQPRLLLLDEPTNHLDIGSQHQVLGLLREQGLATLVVLHDLNLAARYADRVVVLHEGRVRADGAPAAVLDPTLIEEVYAVRTEPRDAGDGARQFLFRRAEGEPA